MKENVKTSFSKKTSPLMFDRIASRYDRLNRVMTLGMDNHWRKTLNSYLPTNLDHFVDMATGTGDQILCFLKQKLNATKITGIDLSENMLKIGIEKLKNFSHVSMLKASMTKLPFDKDSIDAISCSFGIRNVEPFEEALKEFHRVLKPGGTLLILESSRPENQVLRSMHGLYMKLALPVIAKLLKTDPKAYSYLAKTTAEFPCGKAFCKHLEMAGFETLQSKPMALGSVTLYHAKKH